MTKAAAQSDLTGWVPIDFGWRTECLESHLDRIAWMHCGGVSFSEPFFLQTIARLKAEKTRNEIISTNAYAITNRMDSSFDYQPAGIIFHISRCGSTALANCIKLCHSSQVVSEYWPLTQYHWHRVLERENPPEGAEHDLNVLAIKTAAWSLARCRLGTNENLVLKLTSSSLHSLAEIKRIWPSVPRALVLRHPLEVAMRSLRGGGWMALKQDALRSAILLGDMSSGAHGAMSMSDEEYVARVLGNYLNIVAKNLSTFDLIIKQDELTSSKVRELASVFGLNPPVGEKIDRELAVDAKYGRGSTYRHRLYPNNIAFSKELEEHINCHVTPKYNDIVARIDRRKGLEDAVRLRTLNVIN